MDALLSVDEHMPSVLMTRDLIGAGLVDALIWLKLSTLKELKVFTNLCPAHPRASHTDAGELIDKESPRLLACVGVLIIFKQGDDRSTAVISLNDEVAYGSERAIDIFDMQIGGSRSLDQTPAEVIELSESSTLRDPTPDTLLA
jgi:hypothetical protein